MFDHLLHKKGSVITRIQLNKKDNNSIQGTHKILLFKELKDKELQFVFNLIKSLNNAKNSS